MTALLDYPPAATARPGGGAPHVAAAELTVVAPTFNERDNVEPLVARLDKALTGLSWRVIFVDDDSPDGTAEAVKALALRDPRVQCLRRVGRRGLSGAVLEGALASASPFVAVIDADLQHDETLLPVMLSLLRSGSADVAVGSRYLEDAPPVEGFSGVRAWGSALATRMAQRTLGVRLTDPMSGFFMARRDVFDAAAPRLSRQGFKILLDMLAGAPSPLSVIELPYVFRQRTHGQSKLDQRVVAEYLGLLASRLTRDLVSVRAVIFGAVGASGLAVHLLVLKALLALGVPFAAAQAGAAVTAMTSNFLLNNAITYRDKRKRGWGLLSGYLRFCLACAAGLLANLAVASVVHGWTGNWLAAGAAGALFGAIWNYASTSLAVW